MIDLASRHIFIVGGSRGIGAATARLAAQLGARVSFNYARDRAAADTVVADIKAIGREAFATQADIAVDGSIDQAIDTAVTQCGRLDGLVVSAGIFEGHALQEMTTAFWDRIMSINLRGTFFSVRAAHRHMKAAGGSMVIYTSTAGQRGSAVFSAYATSKAAQIMFMRSMAKELAADRIRVNCIAPSWTETDMSSAKMDAIGREQILKGCPLGRVGQPKDVAGATCFLLSDVASFMTGSTMTVDGGIDMMG